MVISNHSKFQHASYSGHSAYNWNFTSQEPRGFGYIQFENTQDADAAVQELKGFKMRGRELDVRFAEGDRKKPGKVPILSINCNLFYF
jgi:RNA recognition motif-containing protein